MQVPTTSIQEYRHTRDAMMQKGRRRFTNDFDSMIVQLARETGAHEFGDACFAALCVSLAEGEWKKKTINRTLVSYGWEPNDIPFLEIQKALIGLGILTPYNPQWTDEFLELSEQKHEQWIEQAQASMLPLEITEDWIQGQKSEFNLKLVTHSPMQDQPQTVLDAVNKLQRVKFRVCADLIPYLDHRIEKIKKKKLKPGQRNMELMQMKAQKAELEYYTRLPEVGFQVTMDFRGRMYYRGGMMTPQGHDFQKASWQFANPVALGPGGETAIAIQLATCFHKAKLSMDDKIQWSHQSGLEMADRIISGEYFPKNADEPFQFIVAAFEWKKLQTWKEEGHNPEEFMSTLVCHQDGSCNGIQHAAALMGHRPTAEATNCTAADTADAPRDIYQDAVDTLIEMLKDQQLPEAAEVLKKVGRSAMKTPLMSASYGSGLASWMRDLRAAVNKSLPQFVHYIDQEEDKIKPLIGQALKAHAGAVLEFNSKMQSTIQEEMEKELRPLFWNAEDGFRVRMAGKTKMDDEKQVIGINKYLDDDSEQPRSRYEIRTDGLTVGAQRNGIAANFIHSIDAAHLRNIVRASDCELVTIHDSVGSHAGNYWDVGYIIREQFVKTHAYNQYESLNELSNLNLRLESSHDYEPSEVLESPYFFS